MITERRHRESVRKCVQPGSDGLDLNGQQHEVVVDTHQVTSPDQRVCHFCGQTEIGRPRDGEISGKELLRCLPGCYVIGSERWGELNKVDSGPILGEVTVRLDESGHQVGIHAQPRRCFRLREPGTKGVPLVVLLHRRLQFTAATSKDVLR